MGYWDQNLTQEQRQAAGQLVQSFQGTTGSNLYAASEKWQAGKGWMTFGRGERKNTHYGFGLFVDATIDWFRGGVDVNGARVPDNALKQGDSVCFKVMDSNESRGMLFKGFALACTRSMLARHGQDPAQVQPDHITDADPAAIIACQGQHGVSVGFTSEAKISKAGNLYYRITLDGGTPAVAPPMSALPPTPPQQPQGNPFGAPQPPQAWPEPGTLYPPPVQTRDQKIAAIKAKMPHLSGIDWSQVTDAQLDAQL